MRRIIYTIFFLVNFGIIQAQRDSLLHLSKYDLKQYHFGFDIGFNRTDFSIRPNNSVLDTIGAFSEPSIGFDLGIIANMRLSGCLDLRFNPGLIFSQRNLVFLVRSGNYSQWNRESYSYKSTIICFPLLLKFRPVRIRNIAPYIVFGGSYQVELNKQFPQVTFPFIKMKDSDRCMELGFGLDFYLKYFKLSPEIKIASGQRNLAIKNSSLYAKAINNLMSNVVMLNLYFE